MCGAAAVRRCPDAGCWHTTQQITRGFQNQQLFRVIFRLRHGAALKVKEHVAVCIADLKLGELALHDLDGNFRRGRCIAPAQVAFQLAGELGQRLAFRRSAHERAGEIRGVDQITEIIVFANRFDLH